MDKTSASESEATCEQGSYQSGRCPNTGRIQIGEAHVRAAEHIRGWAKELAAHASSADVAGRIDHNALLMHSHATCVTMHSHVPVEHLGVLRSRLRDQVAQIKGLGAAIEAAAYHIVFWCDHLDSINASILPQTFTSENRNECAHESLGRRGGVRRGRKFDPELVCDLHTRVKKETRLHLDGIASASKRTVGELIDQMVAAHIRRQTKKGGMDWCEHTKLIDCEEPHNR